MNAGDLDSGPAGLPTVNKETPHAAVITQTNMPNLTQSHNRKKSQQKRGPDRLFSLRKTITATTLILE